MKKLVLLIVGGVLIMATSALSVLSEESAAIMENGKFINTDKSKTAQSNIWEIAKAYWHADRKSPVPERILPIKQLDPVELAQESENTLYRLSHSTVLMHLDGNWVLTDPVFSERASMVQWAGPKRFHQNPIRIEQLPQLKAVVISHDHYDHLDKASLAKLADKAEYFVTPLKVGQHLIKAGIAKDKIIELSWWQQVSLEGIQLTATPAQHFSGRGLFDRDQTLWASWVIQSDSSKVFFSGDTGYFPGFKEIGERLGPFDITLMETGAYNDLWSDIHMRPEESVQAHIDLQGKAMVPIHNGTFDLALHDWFEPLEIAYQQSRQRQVKLLTPIFGERIQINAPQATHAWWHQFMPQNNQLLASPQ